MADILRKEAYLRGWKSNLQLNGACNDDIWQVRAQSPAKTPTGRRSPAPLRRPRSATNFSNKLTYFGGGEAGWRDDTEINTR